MMHQPMMHPPMDPLNMCKPTMPENVYEQNITKSSKISDNNNSTEKKRGQEWCGICGKYFFHLWRHFTKKHSEEPYIHSLINEKQLNKPEFVTKWTKIKAEMVREGGLLEDGHVVCDCGKKLKKSPLAQHIRLFCPKNKLIMNRRQKVQELKGSRISYDWHPESFKELSISMKKDNVYEAGAQDVILVKYISNVLENQFEDDDSSIIKTRFR